MKKSILWRSHAAVVCTLKGTWVDLKYSWCYLGINWCGPGPGGLQKSQVSTVRKEVLAAGKEGEAELRDIVVPGYQDSVVKGEWWIQGLLIFLGISLLPPCGMLSVTLFSLNAFMYESGSFWTGKRLEFPCPRKIHIYNSTTTSG